MQVWTDSVALVRLVVIWGGVCLTAYVVFYLPLTIAPGQTTTVSQGVSFLANLKMNVWFAWGLAVFFGYGWKREHRQRLKEREDKDRRLRELETRLDANVSSSGLNLDGTAIKDAP